MKINARAVLALATTTAVNPAASSGVCSGIKIRRAVFPRRCSGIVLVLVSGLLVVLGLLALFLIGMSRLAAAGSQAGVAQAQASLAAASGMEYAAARLRRSSSPLQTATVGSRGDDWSFRGAPSEKIEATRNPSWAHGECWTDTAAWGADGADNDGDDLADEADEQAGAYCAGEARGPDSDGDGRFSSWTGRLRGGSARSERTAGLVFSLKVESPEGKIPVNAGFLNAEDHWGGKDFVTKTGPGPNTVNQPPYDASVPDHRDPDIEYHRGLVHLLNNLGAILYRSDPTTFWTRCATIPAGGPGADPIDTSWLGYDLIWNRPVGGYKSWAELEQALKTLSLNPTAPFDQRGGGVYTQAQIDRIKPYIDLGPYEALGEGGRATGFEGRWPAGIPAYVPVNLAVAGREVLAGLWMYGVASVPKATAVGGANPPFAGEWAGWDMFSSHTGTAPNAKRFSDLAGASLLGATTLMIHRDEAFALADALIERRRATPLSWEGVYEAILFGAFKDIVPAGGDGIDDDGLSLFQRDYDDLGANHKARRSWLSAKGQMAYQMICQDPYPYETESVSPCWALSWGAANPRFGLPPVVGFNNLYHVRYPQYFGDPDPWMGDPYSPFTRIQALAEPGNPRRWQKILPEGGSAAPPVWFDVASFGALRISSARAHQVTEGRLRIGERLELVSQEDFEDFAGGKRIAGRRITLEDPDPASRRSLATETPPSETPRSYPAVATAPRWNRRSYVAPAPGAEEISPHYGYSRACGAVMLSAREIGRRNAKVYFPFSEDFDGFENTAPPPPTPSEFWAERDPAYDAALPLENDPLMDVRYQVSLVELVFENDGIYRTNPWVVTGTTGLSPQWIYCPGIRGGKFDKMTIEFWGVPGSHLKIEQAGATVDIAVTRNIVEAAPAPPLLGTTVFFTATNGTVTFSGSTFIADDPAAPSWNYHVALASDIVLGNQLSFRLFVNGAEVSSTASQPIPAPVPDNEASITLEKVDEVRLYDYPFLSTGSEALVRYNQGRFPDAGTFTSPTYVFDEEVEMLSTQWAGITPRFGFPAAVRLDGWDKDDNQVWNQVSLGPQGPAGPVPGLSGKARKFRYVVSLQRQTLSPPPAVRVDDTPVFESIGFLFRRAGHSGWTSWTRR